jgi:hypothetical protein
MLLHTYVQEKKEKEKEEEEKEKKHEKKGFDWERQTIATKSRRWKIRLTHYPPQSESKSESESSQLLPSHQSIPFPNPIPSSYSTYLLRFHAHVASQVMSCRAVPCHVTP